VYSVFEKVNTLYCY